MGNRGILLVSSYLLLSLFLVYSSTMALRTTTQGRAADVLRQGYQAIDLAEGGIQQLQDDLYEFFRADVYALRYQGDAINAMRWLDGLDPGSGAALDPAFILPETFSIVEGPTPLSEVTPRRVFLPTGIGDAWISDVTSQNPADPLATRDVTIQAMATVGTMTRRIQTVYQLGLGTSDIFRYAYFINNFGWVQAFGSNRVEINGEVRSNGDMVFNSDAVDASGEFRKIRMNGDVYASQNPELKNPFTGQPAQGLITGDPSQASSWQDYWKGRPPLSGTTSSATTPISRSRPIRKLSDPTQPALGGTPTVLPKDYGWDSDAPQTMSPGQTVKDMPYLGDLSPYKKLAKSYANSSGSSGSSLTYVKYVINPGTGLWESAGTETITSVYAGPDKIEGTVDDRTPLILSGTIFIDGPVVIPGDVLITGQIVGRGSIYAGRNVHIIGNITYRTPAVWPTMERNSTTGQLRQTNVTSGPKANLGYVCSDGTYQTGPCS